VTTFTRTYQLEGLSCACVKQTQAQERKEETI